MSILLYSLQVVWEMRIRDLEEEGWTTAFTDGSGLNLKAAGGFCSNPNRKDKQRQPELSGSEYLGTKSTHFDGELEGIALALETHANTHMVAMLEYGATRLAQTRDAAQARDAAQIRGTAQVRDMAHIF